MVHIGCTLKPGVPMDVFYLPEPTPQEREGTKRGSEPTPLVPLVVCVLAVSLAMALVEVSWASPVFVGMVLLAVVAALRNRIEAAREIGAGETPAGQETVPAARDPDAGQPKSPFRGPARADRRFKGDSVWGLN